MIELVVQRRERCFHVGKIHHPALRLLDFTGNMNLDAERMPMQPQALVPRRQVRQPVRRLDGEDLEDIHGRATCRRANATYEKAPPMTRQGLHGVAMSGGYGWTRTTDLSIMSAAL